jgi:hypothetical protein
MSHNEVQDMIRKALDGEPPVTIEYGRVRKAGRRRLLRRHLGIAGGAVLGVVAVAVVATTIGQLGGGKADSGVATPATTSTAAPGPAGTGCVMPRGQGGYSDPPSGTASPEELAESARLNEAIRRAGIPLPPGVTMTPAQPTFCVIHDSWGASVTLHGPAGDRTLFIEVRPRAGQEPGECTTFGGQVMCEPKTLADGTRVLIRLTPAQPGFPAMNAADVWRSDGTVVRINETGINDKTGRALGDDAMVKLVMAPALKVQFAKQLPPAPAEASDRRAGELTTAAALQNLLPQGMHAKKGPHATAPPLAFYVSQGGYKLDADLVDAQGTGNLFINLNPPAPDVTPMSCQAGMECEKVTLPDGRTATLTTQRPAKGLVMLDLNTVAADGTQVYVHTVNQSGGSQSDAPSRPNPPLDKDKLIEIAMLPALHW